MPDPIFKPPDEVLNEIFGIGSVPELGKTSFWVVISIVILFVCIFIYIFRKDLLNIIFALGTAFYLTDPVKFQSLLECLKSNSGIFIGPIILAIILFYATRDPEALLSNTSSYILVISVVVFITFGMYSSLPDFSQSSYMPFLVGGIALTVIAFASYFSSYITPQVITTIANFLRIIFVLILIIGLAIGYKLFSEKIKSLTGWKGFIANFIFYIPCLLSEGLEYLLQQYNITPNVVFILLFIELVLILSYVYIPKIIHKSVKKKAIVLQNKPVYLDKETIVGNMENFLLKPIDSSIIYKETRKQPLKKNYCINMWVFLNLQPSSNSAYSRETNIFNYNNHPRITHKNVSSDKRLKNGNVYTFYFSNTQDGNATTDKSNTAKYEVSIPDQKWNMLSFNYFETKVDLYINGNLERTFYFSNNIPDYSLTDTIILGKNGGLNGVICNVTYSRTPYSTEEIATMYNINYLKNPPVDILE